MTSRQAPVGSSFGAASTASEVVRGHDLHDKSAIVTGGHAGIGLETVRALRSAGAHVIVPARDHARAARALEGLDGVVIEPMDLLDPASIDAFAARFVAGGAPLHIVVNSAGIMACPLARDARGYESQLATNHLGHVQLVTRLLPALRKANGARVVSVSSRGHRYSPFVFEDPSFERRAYEPFAAYGQSKTANILFALSLDERERDHGVRAFSLHPGTIASTDLGRHIAKNVLQKMGVIDGDGKPILDASRGLKTAEQGAATSVWCATSHELDGLGGVYCENCEVALPVTEEALARWKGGDPLAMVGVMPHAIDPESAARLWRLSEEMLGG